MTNYNTIYEERVGRNRGIEFVDWKPRGPACNFQEIRHAKGTLYVIQGGPLTKIGITRNIKSRFSALQSHCPVELRILATRSVPLAGLAYAESYAHAHLAQYRRHGEWFECDFATIKPVLSRAVHRGKVYHSHCAEWDRGSEARDKAYMETDRGKAEFADWLRRRAEVDALLALP